MYMRIHVYVLRLCVCVCRATSSLVGGSVSAHYILGVHSVEPSRMIVGRRARPSVHAVRNVLSM